MTQTIIEYGPGAGVAARELQTLFAQTTWAERRTVEGIEAMLRATSVSVAARSGGVLVGYARAVTDGVYRALIDDVVVDEGWRRRGVGRDLVERLLERLKAVEKVRLNCRPELVSFYDGMGFTVDLGTQMRAPPDHGSSR